MFEFIKYYLCDRMNFMGFFGLVFLCFYFSAYFMLYLNFFYICVCFILCQGLLGFCFV